MIFAKFSFIFHFFKKYFHQRIISIELFPVRVKIYAISIVVIALMACIIIVFHPITWIAKLFVALALASLFGLPIVFFFEIQLNIITLRIKPLEGFQIWQFWIMSFIAYCIGYLAFSIGELVILRYVTFLDFSFFKNNIAQYKPFSIIFSLKFFPIYLIIASNATYLLIREDNKRKKPIVQAGEPITIEAGKEVLVVYPNDITHISVFEHYSHIFIKTEEGHEEREVYLSLKNAMQKLPEELFVRIHRSHVANIRHISEIKKIDGIFQVVIGDNKFILPISRRQYVNVRQKIQDYFNKSETETGKPYAGE